MTIQSLKDVADRAASKLSQLTDELKVQVHLGGKEAQDLWASVQPHLEKVRAGLHGVSSELATASDEAELKAHLGVRELKDRLEAVGDGLRTLETSLQKPANAAMTKVDEAKLQATLAKAELLDAFERQKAALTQRFTTERDAIRAETQHLLGGFVEQLNRFTKKDG